VNGGLFSSIRELRSLRKKGKGSRDTGIGGRGDTGKGNGGEMGKREEGY